jgi:hypothetical protein
LIRTGYSRLKRRYFRASLSKDLGLSTSLSIFTARLHDAHHCHLVVPLSCPTHSKQC